MDSLKSEMAKGYGLLSENRENGLPQGYFPHWEYNVYGNFMKPKFIKMFHRGSGSELDKKGAAIYSSSMLGYNFFHWIDENGVSLTVDGVKTLFTNVYFEVHLKTLVSSNAPANMDVVLTSKDGKTMLLIESKLSEYFDSNQFSIRGSYSNQGNYCCFGREWSELVVDYREHATKDRAYYEGVKQNICHLIAINNLAKKDEKAIEFFKEQNPLIQVDVKNVEKFVFWNLLFDPNKSKFPDQHKRLVAYGDLLGELSKKMRESDLKVKLDKTYRTYSELWDEVCGSIPEDLRVFLWRRYMQFSNAKTHPEAGS